MKGDVLDFIDYVRQECDAVRVDIDFQARRGVAGYFDGDRRRLVVSLVEQDWLTVLAHEFGHMQDWRAGLFPTVWGATGPCELFDAWLEGKTTLTPRKLVSTVREIQHCELSAEHQAAKLIRSYGLTHNLELWTKKAWWNVQSYEFGRRHRTWWCKNPWDIPEIAERLPKRLPYVSELNKLDATLETLVLAHCTEKK